MPCRPVEGDEAVKVDIKTFYEPAKSNPKATRSSKPSFLITVLAKEETIDCDAILMNIGFVINLDFLKSWGLKMEVNAISVNEKMETSLPGVYAAGDICAHAGKAQTPSPPAPAEAATAVNFAVTFYQSLGQGFSWPFQQPQSVL